MKLKKQKITFLKKEKNKMKIILKIICFLFIISCKEINSKDIISKKISQKKNIQSELDSDGVISFISIDSCLNKEITIFNDNGSKYLSFKLTDYEVLDSLKNLKIFNPLMFYPDNYILQFEYFEKNGIKKIYIDKKRNVVKELDANNCFNIEKWDEYLFSAIVEFDFSKNPLRKKPNIESELFEYKNSDDIIFTISKIKGDWIYIECSDICDYVCKKNVGGWIKWRSKGEIIIKLYFTC